MSARIERTQGMLAALSRSDEAALRNLLSEVPTFMALGTTLDGVDGVLDRIVRQPVSEMYRQVTWSAPEITANGTRATGHMPASTPRAGCVVSFSFDGDRICLMQHQNLPPRTAPAAPLCLTQDLRTLVDNALASRHPMLVAYTDESGQPVLSFRGSIQAYGDDRLALWIRNAGGGMLRSLQHNPKVAMMYRDEESRATYQFQGRARVTTDAAERERIYAASAPVEQAHDFARLGVAVIIDLDRIEGYAGLGPAGQIGRVLMVRSADSAC